MLLANPLQRRYQAAQPRRGDHARRRAMSHRSADDLAERQADERIGSPTAPRQKG